MDGNIREKSKGSTRGDRECERFAMGRRMSLKRAGQTLFAMPRSAVVRSFALNYLLHHRARSRCTCGALIDVPVLGTVWAERPREAALELWSGGHADDH